MTISIKSPTSTTGSIQKNGSDVITIDASDNVTVANDLTVSGTISGTGTSQWTTSGSNISYTTGNVLVGKTSPDYTVVGFEATPSSAFQTNAMTGDGRLSLLLARKTNDGALIQFRRDTTQVGSIGAASGGIYFGSGTSSTERMRITSSGNVLVGSTSVVGTGRFQSSLSSSGFCSTMSSPGNQADYIQFWNGSEVGSIKRSGGTGVSYNTSSDYRLKENVSPMSGSIDRLKQLKPSTWSWVQDGSYGEGFIAHEAQEVVPESVHGTKDAMKTEEYEITPAVLDDDGNVVTEAVMGTREVPDYQGIDQSKLVPLLTAALQEAIQRIEALEAK